MNENKHLENNRKIVADKIQTFMFNSLLDIVSSNPEMLELYNKAVLEIILGGGNSDEKKELMFNSLQAIVLSNPDMLDKYHDTLLRFTVALARIANE